MSRDQAVSRPIEPVSPEPLSPEPQTPIRFPIMRQSWRNVSFIHWRVEPGHVRKLIPRELELDVYNGDCWVGLVPFLIIDLTTPKGPALPWLSRFPETNVRTYVIDRNGRRGVWFFSLDAARWPAVVGARVGFGLPYFWARMEVAFDGQTAKYESRRIAGPTAMSRVVVQCVEPIENPSLLEVFLTARFRLYAERFGRLVMADISHPPWPLQRASIVEMRQTLAEAAGLPVPDDTPLVHFTKGVDVIVGPPVLV